MVTSMHAGAQTIKLQLSAQSITFIDRNPLSKTDIPAAENPISATVSYSGKGVVHIFMLANGNMTGDGDKVVIPIDRVYWTGTGSGYEGGTLSLTQEVEASNGILSTDKNSGWNFYLKHGFYGAGAFQLSITLIATVQ
jgi:hypothetical protein